MKEALKEVGRWILLFIGAWIATTLLAQVNLVPEMASFKVWVFTFAIPVREVFIFVLTFLGRLIDKWQHEKGKVAGVLDKGFIPF